jgi:hypothetical protein
VSHLAAPYEPRRPHETGVVDSDNGDALRFEPTDAVTHERFNLKSFSALAEPLKTPLSSDRLSSAERRCASYIQSIEPSSRAGMRRSRPYSAP